jgi:hypothetical protein
MKARTLALPMLALCLAGLLAAAPAAAEPSGARRLPAEVALPGGFAPEDITSGRGASFYVGSLADGAVYRGSFVTGKGKVLVRGEQGRLAVGVHVDRRNRLWVTGGFLGDTRVYDAATGSLLASYQLAPAGSGFVSDVHVTARAAYFTDSFVQQMYVVRLDAGGALPGQDRVETVPLRGDVTYVPGTGNDFDLNGIARFAGRLIMGQTNTGRLFTVDPATGVLTEIDLGGERIVGADGIAVRGNKLYAALNFPQQVAVVALQRGSSGRLTGKVTRTITDPRFDIPTAVAHFGGGVYALNARFGTPVTPDTAYQVVRVRR